MSKHLHIDNRKYLSSVAAGEAAGYSADHLSRLCRGGALNCRRVGRVWFIEENSLNSFLDQKGRTQATCRHADMMSEPSLSDYNQFDNQNNLTVEIPTRSTMESLSPLRVGRAVLTTFSIIAFTVGGYAFARTYDSPLHPVIQSAARDAKVGAQYSFNQLVQAFPNTVGRLERGLLLAQAGGAHTSSDESEIAVQQSEMFVPQVAPEIIEQTIVQQPVIERIVEKHFTVVESGVTLEQLQETENELRQMITTYASERAVQPIHNFRSIALTQRINNLGDVDISNSRITSSSVEASSLTVSGAASFADLTLTGDLTVSGDDITLGTNTAGYLLVADGTNFNPVAMSGDVAIDGTGATTIQADAVGGAEVSDDSLDFANFSDTLTVDATTTFDLDTNSADFNFDSNTLFVDSSTNRIGIGTASPASRLHIAAPTNTATSSSQFASRVTVTADPASASTAESYGQYNYSNKIGDQSITSVVGSYDFADNNGSGTITNLRGSSVIARNNASGTVTNMRGVSSHAYNNSTGSVTNAYGVYSLASNYDASGTVTNAYGGFFDTYLAAGSITNGYGVFISDVEGTNQFGLYQTSATDKNYFAGNVGIGLTNPSAKLQVHDGFAENADALLLSDSVNGTSISFDVNPSAGGTNPITQADDSLIIGNASAVNTGALTLSTWATDAVGIRIDGATDTVELQGNVGIGTTGPATSLHVQSTAADGIRLLSDSAGANAGYSLGRDSIDSYWGVAHATSSYSNVATAGDVTLRADTEDLILAARNATGDIRFTTGATDSEKMTIDSSGNVGIGTTAPSKHLHVSGATNPAIRTTDTTNTVNTELRSEDTLGFMGTASNHDLRLMTNGSSRLTIDTSGNVGIGTTGPDHPLHVRTSGQYVGLKLDNGTNNLFLVGPNTAGLEDVNLSLLTGGTTKVFLNTNGNSYLDGGNVGIGTTSPGSLLDVTGTAATPLFLQRTGSSANTNIRFENDAGSVYAGAYGNEFGIGPNGDLNNSPWMRIDSSGNVGIGTTSPSKLLEVGASDGIVQVGNTYGVQISADDSGAALFGSNIYHTETNNTYKTTGTHASYGYSGVETSWGNTYFFNDSGATTADATITPTETMRITTDGNVGIGTTAPSARLEVEESSYDVGKYIGNTSNAAGYVGAVVEIESNNDTRGRGIHLTHRDGTDTANNDWYIGVPYTGDILQIGNALHGTLINSASGPAHKSQAKLAIATNGNVGIGTTSPASELEVDSTGSTYITIDSPTGTYNSGIDLYRNGARKWLLYASGSNDRFYVVDEETNNGVYITQDATSWTANSDIRLKENITDISVLDRLNNYRAVSYDWKESGNHELGVIAQELYEAFPEIVTQGDDAPELESATSTNAWGVSYDRLGPLALQGVKELWAMVVENAARITALFEWKDSKDAQIAALEERLATVEAQLAATGVATSATTHGDEQPQLPTISLIGVTPAHVAVGAGYSDLGAVAKNGNGASISYITTVDGREVTTVEIDTTANRAYEIVYTATADGETVHVTRTVIVGTGEEDVLDDDEDEETTDEDSTEEGTNDNATEEENDNGTTEEEDGEQVAVDDDAAATEDLATEDDNETPLNDEGSTEEDSINDGSDGADTEEGGDTSLE